MASKVRILFLAANAKDLSPLRLGAEVREIEAKIQSSSKRNYFELISKWAVRPHDIAEALMRYHPTVVHFSGHASSTGEILLEDDVGKAKQVGAPQLLDMLSVFRDTIRLVVLNACYSGAGLADLSKDIDYIVATDSMIGDRAATAFAASFYQALGFGRTVQTAFEIGKRQIMLEGMHGAENFNLLIREGVDVSEPFIKKRSAIVSPPKAIIPPPLKGGEDKENGISSLGEMPISQADTHISGQQLNSYLQAIEGYPREAATRSAKNIPLEIEESLKHFQIDYPDPTKVAFLEAVS